MVLREIGAKLLRLCFESRVYLLNGLGKTIVLDLLLGLGGRERFGLHLLDDLLEVIVGWFCYCFLHVL